MEPFADSIEHLCAELARFDLLVQRALLLARQPGAAAGTEEFRGLVISEPEIDAMVQAKGFFGERWQREVARQSELKKIDEHLDALGQQIEARRDLSQQAGIRLALPYLAYHFELSPAEVDILLVALAPELEPRYETLYAYLQNDVTRKRPSIDLALNLICRSEREKLMARRIFEPQSRLLGQHLLELGEEPHDRQPCLLRKFLRMDQMIVNYLIDQLPLSAGFGTLVKPEESVRVIEVEPATLTQLEKLATHLHHTGAEGIVVRLIGQSETGLRHAAETFCHTLGRQLFMAELSQLEGSEARLTALRRDAILLKAILAVSNFEVPDSEAESLRLRQAEGLLWRDLRSFKEPVLLLGPGAAFTRVPHEVHIWRLEVTPPGFTSRQQAWKEALGSRAADIDYFRLADTFHFGGHQIHQTLGLSTGLAALRDPFNAEPNTQDLLEAGRSLSTPRLGHFATQVEPRYTWSDIVLPREKIQQLHGVAAWMKFRHVVHRDWGFGEKVSRGKGLIVLFTGPSGTGKTMAAEVLANELSLDLFQIDLSSVVSKYIGETEKNLSAIFREAEQSQALLFFDEADALFGKRTEVKDAHDRYANIEINYLLQRVDQYQGMVVLATNMQRNLDDAFMRRLQEVVEFPFPDEAHRERIWRGHLPPAAPRCDDIDFTFLARQFKVTGGNIKNIVLNAAFLAAQESRPIAMADLILATKAELQKHGKLCVKTDFGPYYDLIQPKDLGSGPAEGAL
jgi:adenylate kinase family enzyme